MADTWGSGFERRKVCGTYSPGVQPNGHIQFGRADVSRSPNPTRVPAPGVSRKSLAANFCVSRKPANQSLFRRSAVYRANPNAQIFSGRLLVSMLVPPFFAEVLRRARTRVTGKRRPQAC